MIEENIQITFKSPVLLVENVQKSNEFYCNILQQEVESDFGENIGFKSELALWEKNYAVNMIKGAMKSDSREKLSEMTHGHSFELYFEVSSIIDLQKQLQQMQVKFALEVYIPPWGQRTIRIFDPDGYLIEISEKMEDVIIRMKDEGHSTK